MKKYKDIGYPHFFCIKCRKGFYLHPDVPTSVLKKVKMGDEVFVMCPKCEFDLVALADKPKRTNDIEKKMLKIVKQAEEYRKDCPCPISDNNGVVHEKGCKHKYCKSCGGTGFGDSGNVCIGCLGKGCLIPTQSFDNKLPEIERMIISKVETNEVPNRIVLVIDKLNELISWANSVTKLLEER
jgi:hypothetical protein